ncbi:MAG TPA: ATPase domain-containing protein [Candidatus Dormibacteraeota bacterium]|nr:ATPase domain-containing protein [Candidatus Dormibacteraeota bacterium]
MSERLPTGSERLDYILRGGLLKNGINLIIGVPGSGKTILSQQIAFRNATVERPALFLSTLSEPIDKIVRYGDSLDFFDANALRDGRLLYEDIGEQLGKGSFDDVLAELDRHLRRKPGIVVIDSMRAFSAMSSDMTTFRQFLYGLVRRLTASATTSIWNAPYSRSLAAETAEFATADAIIAMDIKQVAERELRVLQVLKLRGSGFMSGEHSYRVTSAGIEVFPRMAEDQIRTPYVMSTARAGTGIDALDALLGQGGYWAGAATLVAGPSGIGKTLMGLHFLFRGAAAGEPGILATFQESSTQLRRIVESFGWSLDDPHIHVLSRGVVGVDIDEWVYELLDLVEKTQARRVMIDSLPDLEIAAADPVRFREWMFSLTQRFTRAGISLMMVVEVAELFQLHKISEHGVSHLADNVILLQYVQEGPELSRALTVLKTRAMHHRPIVHRYEITDKGFILGDQLTLDR